VPIKKKAEAKAARAARRAAARADKLRAAEELRSQTARQMEAAASAIAKLEEELLATSRAIARRDALSSHLGGFYSEIDKLTKGKALVPVTDLVVESINEIVRDAKLIVEGDGYLDRVKEFVPAGDNPVYPDVLIKARTVRESLERFKQSLEGREKHALKMLREAKTIQAAVQHYLDNDVIPSKDDIRAVLGGKFISDTWFSEDEESGVENFDFDRLDKCRLEEYFSIGGSHEAL